MPKRPPKTPPKMAGVWDLDLGEGEAEAEGEGEEEGEGLLLFWERKTASTLGSQPASGDVTVAPPWEVPPMIVEIWGGTMYGVLG